MKKFGWGPALVLALCLAWMPMGALADLTETQIILTTYDWRNDVPQGAIEEHNRPGAEPFSPSGDFSFHSMLPLEDGVLLLIGQYEYRETLMEDMFGVGYETTPPRTDAYAVAVDAEGKRLWSLRIGDPQTESNGFAKGWRMEDGRILLLYQNMNGTFGSHYYIISPDGEVDGMLSTKRLREEGVVCNLQYFQEGFLGGGVRLDSGVFGRMEEGDQIVLLDNDLNTLWNYRHPDLEGTLLYSAARQPGDGFLLYGNRSCHDGDLVPMAVKMSLTGERLWLFEGHHYAIGWVDDALPTDDGGALLVMSVDPTVPTPYDDVPFRGVLVKVSGTGEAEWVKTYDQYGITYFSSMLPMGNGLLIKGTMKDVGDSFSALIYLDETYEAVSFARLPLGEGDWREYAYLAAGPDGSIYVYGGEYLLEDTENGEWKAAERRAVFAKVDEGRFVGE